jgi:hypothetical protein
LAKPIDSTADRGDPVDLAVGQYVSLGSAAARQPHHVEAGVDEPPQLAAQHVLAQAAVLGKGGQARGGERDAPRGFINRCRHGSQ